MDTFDAQHPHVALSRRMLSVGRSSACHITFADSLVPSELCRIQVSSPVVQRCRPLALVPCQHLTVATLWFRRAASHGRPRCRCTAYPTAGCFRSMAARL
jgi:hypothetical protein